MGYSLFKDSFAKNDQFNLNYNNSNAEHKQEKGTGKKHSDKKTQNKNTNYKGKNSGVENNKNNVENNKKGKSNENNSYNGKNRRDNGGYVGAPYNFIPLNFNKNGYVNKPIPHNYVGIDSDGNDLYSGEIVYEIKAEVPIIIDNGQGKFNRDAYGNFAIPGSTMRGLIRNNVQILSLSDVSADIDDYNLMYRDVFSNVDGSYNGILGVENSSTEAKGIAKNVKAGFVKLENGKYYVKIVEAQFAKEANYLMLSSRKIVENKEKFPFFIEGENWKKRMMYTDKCIFERTEIIKCKSIKKKGEGALHKRKLEVVFYTENKTILDKIMKNNKFSCNSYGEPKIKGDKLTIVTKEIGEEGKYEYDIEVEVYKNEVKKTIKYVTTEKNMINEQYYEPYYEKVWFKLTDDGKYVESVVEDLPENVDNVKNKKQKYQEGYVISSGYIDNKKQLYIIPYRKFDKSDKGVIEISERDLKAFNVDLHKRKNQLYQYFHNDSKDKPKSGSKVQSKEELKKELNKKLLSYFGMPQEEGEVKPIFFIKNNDRIYFGFTPRLRLFYNHSIKEGIKDTVVMDYCRALFGYTNEEKVGSDYDSSYKSRLSFTDALSKNAIEAEEVSYILGEPKPTSYLDYLVQDENNSMVTYNADDFSLRGIKQYWLHEKIQESNIKNSKGEETFKNNMNKKESSPEVSFSPLDGADFEGKIRYKNLRKDELGLLLWSLKPTEDFQMNVGKAKAFGYGRIRLTIKSIKNMDMENAYNLSKGLNLSPLIQPYEDNEAAKNNFINECIENYINAIKEKTGKDIRGMDSIKDFFTMKSYIPNSKYIHYMDIDKGEYSRRSRPLDTVEQIKEKCENN